MFAFVAATKIDENFMSQVLEHVLLANGVTPVDGNGFKALDEKKTIEALEFYKAIAKASPRQATFSGNSRVSYILPARRQ